MKLTLELLQNYDTDSALLEFVQKKYSDGVEAIDFIKDTDVPLSWLHFIERYISLNTTELQALYKRCEIYQTTHTRGSSCVFNGSYIYNSESVNGSNYIFNSKQIIHSNHIYASNDVRDCEEVVQSESLNHSQRVVLSSHVVDSSNIIHSDQITAGRNISESSEVNDSQFIYYSNQVSNSLFCGFLKNCSYCLFCTNLKNRTYYIFNKEVSKEDYFELYNSLLTRLESETSTSIEIIENFYDASKRFKFSLAPDQVFNGLSADFYGWVGSLPQYDENLFLELFFKNLPDKI